MHLFFFFKYPEIGNVQFIVSDSIRQTKRVYNLVSAMSTTKSKYEKVINILTSITTVLKIFFFSQFDTMKQHFYKFLMTTLQPTFLITYIFRSRIIFGIF